MAVLMLLALSFTAAEALRLAPSVPMTAAGTRTARRNVVMLDPNVETQIKGLVEKNQIMLFMKGNKLFPQCGFSNTAVQILNSLNVPYETCDVLADQNVREGIKE